MKVLHLISGGDTGGAKTHVLSLVKELEKHIEPKLVCFIEDEFYHEGKALGLDIEVIKQESRFDLHVLKKIKKIIVEENYDIIHSHGARANFICMLLKPMVRKPFATTIHSDYKLDFKDSFYKRFVYTTLNEISLKVFDHYIAISNKFKDMLVERNFNSKKIFVAYNGIDLNEKIEIIPKEDFLNKFGIDYENKFIVGILGRLDAVKNHETFLNAAKKVLESRKDALFLIGGSGGEEEKLKGLTAKYGIEDNVVFLDFITQPDSFFNAIDVNTLTSLSESFPYSILEGARAKKAILSTDVGGLKDLVENDVNGYIFDVGDYESLAKYILRLVENRDKASKMGENLYKTVEEKFSLEIMGTTHFEIYKKIINKAEAL